MNKPSISLIKSALPLLLLFVLAVGTALGFHSRHAQNLNFNVLDIAQIAHHINDGHGFSTDVIRQTNSSNLDVPAPGKYLPEVRRAPLFPVLLAGAFSVGGVHDATIINFTAFLFGLSAILLFVLAKRLVGQFLIPLVTTLAYITSVPVIVAVNAGHPSLLSACLILTLLLVLTPKNEDVEIAKLEDDSDSKQLRMAKRKVTRRYFLIGLWAALCYLADYTSLLYVIPLVCLWSIESRPITRGGVFTFVLGFFIVAMPWWIRNVRVSGNPLTSQELMILTGQLDYVPSVFENLKTGLRIFVYNAVSVPHLILAPFAFICLWFRPASASLARRKVAILFALALFVFGLCAMARAGAYEMVALAPLMAFVGITTFHQLVNASWFSNSISKKIAAPYRFEQKADEPSISEVKFAKKTKFWPYFAFKNWFLTKLRLPFTLHREGNQEILYSGKWPTQTLFEMRAVFSLLAVLLLSLMWQLGFAQKTELANIREEMKPLLKVVDQNHFVLSDVPQAVAWYANRRALPLPERASRVMEMDNTGVGAIYLADSSTIQRLPEWQPAYNGVEIPGYQILPSDSRKNIIYVKEPSIQEAQAELKKSPKNGLMYSLLGKALLAKKQYAKALEAYANAQRLQPKLTEAFVGGGFASAGLNRNVDARRQFQQALQLEPRSLPAIMGMAQVEQVDKETYKSIGRYQQALADSPNNPVALNNMAQLYADQGRNLFRALEMARRAAEQNPQNTAILDTLGWTCHRLGYHEEAIEYLQIAAKYSPQDPIIRKHLAVAKAAKKGVK